MNEYETSQNAGDIKQWLCRIQSILKNWYVSTHIFKYLKSIFYNEYQNDLQSKSEKNALTSPYLPFLITEINPGCISQLQRETEEFIYKNIYMSVCIKYTRVIISIILREACCIIQEVWETLGNSWSPPSLWQNGREKIPRSKCIGLYCVWESERKAGRKELEGWPHTCANSLWSSNHAQSVMPTPRMWAIPIPRF